MDKVTLSTVATSGSYDDLSNKPTIPSAVTESTVSGWGFTKNTGTYSKPSGGIPKTDLASAVQTSLGKADTALQSYTEQYKGTVTGVKVNGSTKSPSSGTVDIGNVVTSIKINGSTKTPSNGVVDLGTITGGTSSGVNLPDAEILPSGQTSYNLEDGKTYISFNTGDDVVFALPTNKYASCRLIIGYSAGTEVGAISFPANVGWQNEEFPEFGNIGNPLITEMSFYNIPRGYGEILTLGVWCKYGNTMLGEPGVEGGNPYE